MRIWLRVELSKLSSSGNKAVKTTYIHIYFYKRIFRNVCNIFPATTLVLSLFPSLFAFCFVVFDFEIVVALLRSVSIINYYYFWLMLPIPYVLHLLISFASLEVFLEIFFHHRSTQYADRKKKEKTREDALDRETKREIGGKWENPRRSYQIRQFCKLFRTAIAEFSHAVIIRNMFTQSILPELARISIPCA